MKINLSLLLCALFIFLQGCAVDSKLVNSQQQTVTHEHRVHLPAALYTAGSSNPPLFEKKGELMLAVDYTHSGENTNYDKNKGGNQANVVDGITHQTSSSTQTYSAKGAYALTDGIGIMGNVTLGSKNEMYTPYIESWNIQKETYQNEYWAWLPVPWDAWNGVSWTQIDEFQTVNNYDKISKNIARSYRYVDTELGVGKFSHKNKWKTEIYGGLGFAQNKYTGHLDRNNRLEVYASHEASLYKVFAQPAGAYSSGWFEAGAALKASYVNYNLKSGSGSGNENLGKETGSQFFAEPSVFMRIGPRACRLSIEHKWLATIGKSRFPVNSSFLSFGIVSILNTGPRYTK